MPLVGQDDDVKGQDDELRHLTPVILPQPYCASEHYMHELQDYIIQKSFVILESAKKTVQIETRM